MAPVLTNASPTCIKPPTANRDTALVRHAIVAGFAARYAIVEPVFAEAHIGQALAAAAVLFAIAPFFGRVALNAKILLLGSGSGAHTQTLSLEEGLAKVPEVTGQGPPIGLLFPRLPPFGVFSLRSLRTLLASFAVKGFTAVR